MSQNIITYFVITGRRVPGNVVIAVAVCIKTAQSFCCAACSHPISAPSVWWVSNIRPTGQNPSGSDRERRLLLLLLQVSEAFKKEPCRWGFPQQRRRPAEVRRLNRVFVAAADWKQRDMNHVWNCNNFLHTFQAVYVLWILSFWNCTHRKESDPPVCDLWPAAGPTLWQILSCSGICGAPSSGPNGGAVPSDCTVTLICPPSSCNSQTETMSHVFIDFSVEKTAHENQNEVSSSVDALW